MSASAKRHLTLATSQRRFAASRQGADEGRLTGRLLNAGFAAAGNALLSWLDPEPDGGRE